MDTTIKFFNIKATICISFFSKLKGKMFSFSRKPLLFVFPSERKIAVHMFFVFMPLLVIWFDKRKRVAEFRILRPFGISKAVRAMYVLELPPEKINRKKLHKGIKINFRI